MTMHPNKRDLAELVQNRNAAKEVSALEIQGPDPTQADSSEQNLTDDPTALYDLGIPNASPPQ